MKSEKRMKKLKIVPLSVSYGYIYSKDVDSMLYASVLYFAPKELVKDALTIGTNKETEEAKVLRRDMEDSLKYDLGSRGTYFRGLRIESVEKADLDYSVCQLFRKVA